MKLHGKTKESEKKKTRNLITETGRIKSKNNVFARDIKLISAIASSFDGAYIYVAFTLTGKFQIIVSL